MAARLQNGIVWKNVMQGLGSTNEDAAGRRLRHKTSDIITSLAFGFAKFEHAQMK
jgi:hypothetical protein